MGWIKLDRRILENPLWSDKPFARGQAWVDLLLLANHDTKEFLQNGRIVKGERGNVYRSVSWLALRWGWSRKKTRGFLEELQSAKMCSVLATTQGTTITIEKYTIYQGGGTTEGTTKEQRRNSGGNIYKNNKEYIKNINNNNIAVPLVSEVEKFIQKNNFNVDPFDFYDYYAGQGWTKANGQPVKDWRACVRAWHRRASKEKGDQEAKAEARAKRLAEMAEQEKKEVEEMNRKAAEFRRKK